MATDSPEKPPKVRLASGQEVSLGCGTLILIALIVMIFSHGSRNDKTDLGPVLHKLDAIEKRLDQLEKQLKEPKGKPPDK